MCMNNLSSPVSGGRLSWVHVHALPSFVINCLHHDDLSILSPCVSGAQGFQDADVFTPLGI